MTTKNACMGAKQSILQACNSKTSRTMVNIPCLDCKNMHERKHADSCSHRRPNACVHTRKDQFKKECSLKFTASRLYSGSVQPQDLSLQPRRICQLDEALREGSLSL